MRERDCSEIDDREIDGEREKSLFSTSLVYVKKTEVH